jgi:hypothetical protein
MGVSGQRHARLCFSPGKRAIGTHWTGGWVGHRAGLDTDAREKILSPLPGIEPQSPRRPVRSQTLYWLSYPAHDLQPSGCKYEFKVSGVTALRWTATILETARRVLPALRLGRIKWKYTDENCTVRTFEIWCYYQMLSRRSNETGWDVWGMWHEWGR